MALAVVLAMTVPIATVLTASGAFSMSLVRSVVPVVKRAWIRPGRPMRASPPLPAAVSNVKTSFVPIWCASFSATKRA